MCPGRCALAWIQPWPGAALPYTAVLGGAADHVERSNEQRGDHQGFRVGLGLLIERSRDSMRKKRLGTPMRKGLAPYLRDTTV